MAIHAARHRAGSVALLGAATIALGAATASGAALTQESGTVSVDASDFGVARAICGQGKTAIAGGFETQFDPANPASSRIAVAGNRRSGRVWYVSTRNRGAATGTLTSFAVCRDEPIRLAFEELSVAGGASEVALRARCTRGTKAVSGGYYGELNAGGATTQVVAHRSARIGPRSWEAAVSNVGGSPGGLLSFVYCHDGRSLRAVEQTVTVPGGAFGFTVTDVVARCDRGMRAVSGGFDTPTAFGGQAVMLASRPTGKRAWLVRVATALPQSTAVTGYAYCEET